MTYKGFDTSIRSRFDAALVDMLTRWPAQYESLALPSAPVLQADGEPNNVSSSAVPTRAQPGALGSLRHPHAQPLTAKADRAARQRVVVQGSPVEVPLTRPASHRIDMAITPARPLQTHTFAGGLDWHATQKSEE